MTNTNLIPIEKIEKAIYFIRGEKVMLDRDLAKLYGVLTGALNQAVRRNRERFPEDFLFQLTPAEIAQLNLSQIVIGSEKHRNPRLRPYAFTEQRSQRDRLPFARGEEVSFEGGIGELARLRIAS